MYLRISQPHQVIYLHITLWALRFDSHLRVLRQFGVILFNMSQSCQQALDFLGGDGKDHLVALC
jgi:hypothetical protein